MWEVRSYSCSHRLSRFNTVKSSKTAVWSHITRQLFMSLWCVCRITTIDQLSLFIFRFCFNGEHTCGSWNELVGFPSWRHLSPWSPFIIRAPILKNRTKVQLGFIRYIDTVLGTYKLWFYDKRFPVSRRIMQQLQTDIKRCSPFSFYSYKVFNWKLK